MSDQFTECRANIQHINKLRGFDFKITAIYELAIRSPSNLELI